MKYALLLLVFTTFAQAQVAETGSGKIIGLQSNDISIFLGIPYAAPPVAELRWKKPAPVTPWDGLRKTQNYGPNCLQRSLLSPAVNLEGSEDCLYLNVWTPKNFKNKNQKKFPVMFFVHGGAYLIGGANQFALGSPYDGENLARNQSVVVVTINYRLGIFGFLVHPELKGNFGLLDTIAALKWVQNNIENFGGDKNNVMLFGESAGAMIAGALVASPMAKNLFAKASIQSGYFDAPHSYEREHLGLQLAEKYGCLSLECLRKVSAEQIVSDQMTLFDLLNFKISPGKYYHLLPYSVVIDDDAVPRSPVKQVELGLHNKIPVIIGTNADETNLFATPDQHLTCYQYESAVRNDTGDLAEALLKRYPCGLIGRKAAQSLLTAIYFLCPTRKMANALSEHNEVYRYLFSHQIVGPLGAFGATHFLEVPLIFGNLSSVAIAPLPTTMWLANRMQKHWGNFAHTSSPNSKEDDEWPRYQQKSELTYRLATFSNKLKKLEKENCEFLDTLVK